jgi:uncharacterized membrane protein
MPKRKVGSWIVIVMFSLSGVLHLLSPAGFLTLMPPELGESVNLTLIYASGVVELVCAGGLLLRWRWAPLLTVATLLAVWPANIWYAFDQLGSDDLVLTIAAWVRLPLQIVLIWWAWKSPVKNSQRHT